MAWMLRMKDEDFDRVIQTNLRGAFVCVREAAKIMTRQRHGGHQYQLRGRTDG